MYIYLLQERRELVSGDDKDLIVKKYGTSGFQIKEIAMDRTIARNIMEDYCSHYEFFFGLDKRLVGRTLRSPDRCTICYKSNGSTYLIYLHVVERRVREES